ncbi:hypothetical protein HPY24_18110 [Methylobacterium sp. IIF1SW-B5]|nr:hypothetical protein [Methylobacterium ajmalii]
MLAAVRAGAFEVAPKPMSAATNFVESVRLATPILSVAAVPVPTVAKVRRPAVSRPAVTLPPSLAVPEAAIWLLIADSSSSVVTLLRSLAVDLRVSLSSWIVALAPPPRSMTKLICLVWPAVTVAKSAVPPEKAPVPVSEVEPTTWAAVAGFVTVVPALRS